MKSKPTRSGDKTKPQAVNVPAGFSDGHKTWAKRGKAYFRTKTEAANFCARLNRWKELRRSPVADATFQANDNELHWLGYLRERLPDLSLLPAVMDCWDKHGATVSMTLADAVQKYIDFRISEKKKSDEKNISEKKSAPDTGTIGDVRTKLKNFSAAFPGKMMHEISVEDLDEYLNGYPAGWSRRSVYKRVSQFLGYCATRKMISDNPAKSIKRPEVEYTAPTIYTVEQVETVLNFAAKNYKDIAPAFILQSFGYLRTAELVPENGSDPVLDWSNIDWADKEIFVPKEVAKKAKAEADNSRYTPMKEALIAWLEPYKKPSGRIVTVSEKRFADLRTECFKKAGVTFEDNALRHGAISYSIANGDGIGTIANWAGSSEATIRKHYKRAVKAAHGRAYFALRRSAE
jgi:integrase